MKLKNICLSGMFVVVAVPAFAAEASKKPVTNWTCEDFLSIDDVFKPKVVYAATPHVKRRKHADLIDIDETEKVIPVVTTECQKVRQNALLRELEAAWDKVEAGAKVMEKKM